MSDFAQKFNHYGEISMDIKTLIEQKKAEKLAKLAEAPAFVEASVNLGIREDAINKLESLIEQVESLFQQAKHRSFRSRLFGYSAELDKLHQLVFLLRYTPEELKPVIQGLVPLNEALIEELVEAFGQLSYYSPKHATIVEGKPLDSGKLEALLPLVETSLGIIIDAGDLSKADSYYQVALAKAKTSMNEAQHASKLESLALELD